MEQPIEIYEINYQTALPIRHRVLWPDKPVEFCIVEDDQEGWHYGLFYNDTLVCVASVFPKKTSARLRKFATLPEYQGRGFGTRIIQHILKVLGERKIKEFWCDAREHAIPFYSRFGMKPKGECFYKEEVPYYKMAIKLEP